MNAKKNINFRTAKRKVRRRKILRFIFKKLLFLSLLRKFCRIALKYLIIGYAAAVIGFNAGNQESKHHFQHVTHQREEIGQLNKNLKENLDHLSTKDDRIQQLEHDLLEEGKSNFELDKDFQKTFKRLSQIKYDQGKLLQEIKNLKIDNKDLYNNNKKSKSTSVIFEKEIQKSKHQFETKKSELKKDIQLLNNDLKNKNNEISTLTKSFNQKLSFIENLETKIKNTQLEKIDLNSNIQILKQKIESIYEEFEAKFYEQNTQYNKLELQIVIKNEQLELKELEIQELKNQLQNQEQLLLKELSELHDNLKALANKFENFENQKRLDWFLRAIDQMLRHGIKKF